ISHLHRDEDSDFTTMAALPTFPQFDVNGDDVSQRWERYVTRFKNLLKATDIKDPARGKALLLHYAGEDVNTVFESLVVAAATETISELDQALTALLGHFAPKKKHRV
ncbi:hypothetical protein AC249_AIPGENE14806, partial [Exaiptasia diaphana]